MMILTTPLFAIPFPQIDPVLIELGPLVIRWYALAYILGLILGWFYVKSLSANTLYWGKNKPIEIVQLDDLLLWVTLGVILGGRLGYVLFYSLEYYLSHPVEIFALWQGGMSFHGGLLGVSVAILIFCKLKNLTILSVFDLVTAAAPIGLFFGRIANFINGELYGRVSDVPWAMVFPAGGPDPRHPSQLYEAALEGVLIFLVLNTLIKHKDAFKTPGLVSGIFLILYGLSRSCVEFFRMPDAHIGFLTSGLTMGMILSIPMILLGLYVMLRAKK